MNFYLHKYGPEGGEHFHLHHDDIHMSREQAIVLRDRLNELLKMMDAAQDTNDAGSAQAHNSESVKLPSKTLLLSKCSFFETCPVSGKGHAGCYSEAPCFKR